MKFQGLKTANITALFSTQLNHQTISSADIISIFTTGEPKKDEHSGFEAPGLKVISFPNQKKTIAFEPNRLIVANDDDASIEISPLVKDFLKVFNLPYIDGTKLAAYGFNLDSIAESEDNNLAAIVGPSLLKIASGNASGGAIVNFEKDNVKYVIDLKPTSDRVYHAHFNAHYQASILPSEQKLASDLEMHINQFRDIVEEL